MKRRIPRTITVDWLKAEGACRHEVRRFKRLFPDGARLTRDNLQKAPAGWLGWLSRRLSIREWHRFYLHINGLGRDGRASPADALWDALKRDKVVR